MLAAAHEIATRFHLEVIWETDVPISIERETNKGAAQFAFA